MRLKSGSVAEVFRTRLGLKNAQFRFDSNEQSLVARVFCRVS